MADQGGDTNLTTERIVNEFKTAEAKIVITEVVKPHVQRGVSGEVCVKCSGRIHSIFT